MQAMRPTLVGVMFYSQKSVFVSGPRHPIPESLILHGSKLTEENDQWGGVYMVHLQPQRSARVSYTHSAWVFFVRMRTENTPHPSVFGISHEKQVWNDKYVWLVLFDEMLAAKWTLKFPESA